MKTLLCWFRQLTSAWTGRAPGGQPEEVLSAINAAASSEPVHERLARLCRLVVSGGIAGAELELYDWQQHEQCPTSARVLLAALFARRDRLDEAVAVLLRPGRFNSDDDALAGQTLVTLLVSAGQHETAADRLRQMYDDLGQKPAVMDWLRLMRMPGSDKLPTICEASVDQLAAELLCRPEVITSLVKAQQIEPDADSIVLLSQAISRMALYVVDEKNKLMICQAMSSLSKLAVATDDSRRWARHGLQLDPQSAPLALTLAQVSDDSQTHAHAAVALQRASAAHPDYPDVRRAMILCEYRHGDTHIAKEHLQQWLERQPGHPVATRVAEELAA
jgi:tetratricopeptide (TPR) repeat protein